MNSYVVFYTNVDDLTGIELRALYRALNDLGFHLVHWWSREFLQIHSGSPGGINDCVVITCALRAFLAEFRPDETWVLDQGYWCDHPIAGQGGDGWAIVTATMITWGSTPEALVKTRRNK